MTRHAQSAVEAWRLRATGLVYLVVLAALVWLSIAAYDKAFTDHVTVEVTARKAGLQLNVGGDVRMNGAIVGRVSGVRPGAPGAVVELQIDGDAADEIPTDVTARILPTTLFGQKFVELSSPADPAAAHLTEGARIAEDPGPSAVEVNEVLDRLDPLLTAVRPERLASTLSALSTGLDGRGARLGELIDGSGAYLEQLNELTPGIERDLGLLRDVSGQYAAVAPDLLQIARDASRTSRTIRSRSSDLERFFTEVRDVAAVGDRVLRDNRDAIVATSRISRPTLELLAQYSPELPCVLDGFLAGSRQAGAQVKGGSIQGNFTLGAQVPGYAQKDALKLGDVGTGPSCRGLPNAPVPYPGVVLDDGYTRPKANDLLPILLGPDIGGGS